jgi:hypothetical protein
MRCPVPKPFPGSTVPGSKPLPGSAVPGSKPFPGSAVPGKLVKLTVEIPLDVEVRLHGLARFLGIPKRVLAGKLLSQGLDRYLEDGRFRAIAAELTGEADSAA